jgi:hypothetical protein
MTIIPGRLSEYRKRLSDPGRRSTIPNAYLQKLNPQLYAKRQANVADAKRTARNDVLYDPVRQLTGSQIYSLSKAQASSQYDPAINNAIQDRRLAIANDAALAERVAGYNQMASSALATAHEQAQSGASDLAAKLAGTNSSLMTQLGNDQGRDQQFAQDDAALRGAQNSPGMSERLAADFQQQRQGIAANAAAQETAGNVQAQGWAGLLGMMQGAQAMQGADNLAQIRNASAVREDKLGRDITGLQGEKGAAIVENTNKLRSSEFDKAAAIQTLNIKTTEANTKASAPGPESTYDKETARWAAKLGLTPHQFMVLGPNGRAKRIDAYNLKQHPKKAGSSKNDQLYTSGPFAGLTASQITGMPDSKRQEKIDQYNSIVHPGKSGTKTKTATADEVKGQWLPPVAQAHAISDFHRLQGDPALRKMKQDGKTRQEAADAIQTSDKWGKLDPSLISAALDMVYNGHISPGTAAKLHRSKVKVSGLGVPVRKPGVQIHKRSGSTGPAGGDPAGRF